MKPGQCANDISGKGGFQTVRIKWDEPCPVITKLIGGIGFGMLIHPEEHRVLSVDEMKLATSFPLSFQLIGRYQDQRARIGNCVPPLLMKAIAENIKKAPFMKDTEQPTVISTFAGCGGSSLGYKMAGFKELLAVEWDDNAVETFKLNFPGVPVYHGDIAKLSGAECMKLAGGIKPGELDVLDGSPPCQGFSTAGKRKYNDPRNSLFKEYARLLAELQPKVFVMENVTGLVKGHMKQIYLKIMATLRGCGYTAKGEVMNAMYYGVPQSRQRVIIIGVRNDLGIDPTHPKPQTIPKACGKALDGIVQDEPQREWLLKEGIARISINKFWPHLKPGEHGSKLTAGSAFSCIKYDPSKPSPTIPKTDGNIGLYGGMHWDEMRRFTLPEYKRFASFPDHFSFAGKWSDGVAQIGNSVPPLLMKAIAEHIRKAILMPISRARIASGPSETAVPCLAKAGA
jgi:DNA (cytosine-5)-methyltransferase 1